MKKFLLTLLVCFFNFSIFLFFYPKITIAQTTDIKPFLGQSENRIDRNGDGRYDSYSLSEGSCRFSLFDLSSRAKVWTTVVPDCSSLFDLVFHTKSFMGDDTRDFTITGKGLQNSDLDWWLWVGDGATGQIRNFKYFLGNAAAPGILRINGIQVVDFKLPQYPQPLLLVRTTADGYHGHLFYFPSGSSSSKEVTSEFFQGTPFPGVDMPDDGYTKLYNSFNQTLIPCSPINGSSSCGVPDASSGKGSGYFLDQVAIGDLDLDGVDDVLMSFFWRIAAYPGRPKGQIEFIGAPQYDNYYNPQNDGTGCHSGRHYGLTAIAPISGYPYPATINIAGTPINNFLDPYQNVSRNVAVVGTFKHESLPTFERKLLWNTPYGTSIPNCGANMTGGNVKLYDRSLHIPADGLIRNQNNIVSFIHVNRWSQNENFPVCDHGDIPCHNNVLSKQTGHWSWQVLDVKNGNVRFQKDNTYVWDVLADKEKNGIWVIFSSTANTWNLGFATIDGKDSLFRDDLSIGFFDINSLTITNVQNLPAKIRPFLKHTRRQSLGRSIISHGWSYQVFRLPGEGRLPDFLLVTPDNFLQFGYSEGRWTERAKYGKDGSLIATLATPTPTPTPKPTIRGDINGDGKVDIYDYNLLVTNFGKTGSNVADIDGNGKVDIFDYNILVGNFGKSR